MSDNEGDDDFAVYITAPASDPVDPAALMRALDDNFDPEDNPFIITSDDSFRGRGAQSVISHHRDVEARRKRTNKDMFLIADRGLPKGVLMVNLKPYHGYVDALRQEAGLARNSIASMSIANTDWYEERESVGAEQREAEMVPEDRFALYNTLPADQDASFETALNWMNDGVGELGIEGEQAPLPIGAQRSYYRAVRVAEGFSLDEIFAQHASRAGDSKLDPAVFAVVDAEWESRGLIVARVSPEQTSFRCKTPVAGEILNWVFIGLMTWEEAEAQYAAR